MTATNFPEFNAAVTELTTKVSTLLGDVATMQSIANVQVAVDKAAAASTSAEQAATSASAAASSEASATTSKNASAASATKAGQWAENAENVTVETGKYSAKHHAIKSAASATSAASSATTATTKASEASTSATNAGTSATKASQWAENAENTAVETGKYSAKHHALKAATSATNAAASASTATTKASEAATSAANAANSATTATTKASEASTSATNAAASASTATTKATEASTSATTAGVKAAEASTSATSAAASSTKAGQWADANENVAVETGKYSAKHHAIKAAASASAAAASQSSASTSAGAATTKAGEAATSATNAANSAATATTKASEAATSATNAANANTAAQSAKTAAEAARDEAVTAASSLTGTLSELGSVDLSSGAYPTTPTSAGFWKVTVGGTVGGVDYGVGDTLVYSKNLNQFYKIDNTESVSSVNGKTGVVTLVKADVGLGSVDNTSDSAKPISTATQSALNAKLSLAGGSMTGQLSADKGLKWANQYPEYGWLIGGGTDFGWKKLCDVTIGTGLYRAATFAIEVLDLKGNFGQTASFDRLLFSAAFCRSAGVQDDQNRAEVVGPVNEFIRVVKTATGVYELQARSPSSYRHIAIKLRLTFESGGTFSYAGSALSNGSTTGTIYTPITSSGALLVANISAHTISAPGGVSGDGASLTNLTLANVTGLQSALDGKASLAALDSKVSLTGDQSVAGVKTFSTALAVTGTSKAAGRFYGGTTDPSNTTRTNYDGKLHATGFGSGRFVMEYNAATESLDFNFV